MRANTFFLIVITFLFPCYIYSQSNYIENDSVKTIGLKIIDGPGWQNSEVCLVTIGGKITKYSPFELNEYGFKDGRVYISKSILKSDSSIKRVFLERLVKGNTTLYYYKGKTKTTFYIERDSSHLFELTKKDIGNKYVTFHEKLLQLTSDCGNVSEATRLVSYNKKSFTKLIQQYNNCEVKPFPFFKYGFIVGYAASKISILAKSEFPYSNNIDYKYDPGLTMGIFIDKPVFVSDFSIRSELLFSQNGYSYNWSDGNLDVDLLINTASITIPLLIRYTYPSVKGRPFFNVGGTYTYNIRKDVQAYEASLSDNLINIRKVNEDSFISPNLLGFSAGAGFQYKLTFRSFASIELRYDILQGVPHSGNLKEVVQLISSLSF